MKIIKEPRVTIGDETVITDAPISYMFFASREGIQDAHVVIALETQQGDTHRYRVRLTLDDARKLAENLVQWVKYYESDPLNGQDERDYLVGEGY